MRFKIVGPEVRDGDGGALDLGGGEAEDAAGGHGVAGVDGVVEEGLLDLEAVGVDPEGGGDGEGSELDGGGEQAPDEGGGVVDECGDGDGGFVAAFGAAEGEEGADDAAGLLGETRVAGVEPVLVLPGLARVGGEDAPDGARSSA